MYVYIIALKTVNMYMDDNKVPRSHKQLKRMKCTRELFKRVLGALK